MSKKTMPKIEAPKTDLESSERNERRASVLASGLTFDPKKYEFSEAFVPADISNPLEVHTVAEMIECVRKNPKIEIDARVLGVTSNGRGFRRMNRDQFMEAMQRRDSKKFRESIDGFANDSGFDRGGVVGSGDFTPLLGGPFFKQLYQRDYLRMHSAAFYAFHHDPVAKGVTNIFKDFTLGRGYTINSSNTKAMIIWKAFEAANELDTLLDFLADELTTYGEVMLWFLPSLQSSIVFNPRPGETVPRGLIPRVRLIDPSAIVEVVTQPEDVSRVLFYQWLAPTQYQNWTDGKAPVSKFIFQQIPGDQVEHLRLNSVSNEKRGRSDFFPALGYMKRLRDTVDYSVITMQKNAAWAIDTEIDGSQEDIDGYIDSQRALGTIAPAGSEFVHSSAVKRTYLNNASTSSGLNDTPFAWCLSMVSVSTGIPVSYLGTHLSGGTTKASALVATEPVAKRFEKRRALYEKVIRKMWDRLMKQFGIHAECEVTFPELITQDRTAKLRDIDLAEVKGIISRERAAEMTAKELDITNYNFQAEQEKIQKEQSAFAPTPGQLSPLTAPPAAPLSGVPGTERTDAKAQDQGRMTPAPMPAAGTPPGAAPAAMPTGAGAPEDIQKTALNGAQIASLLQIVTAAAEGQIPRASAVELIIASFPTLDRAEAERILGEIGKGFEPKAEAPPAMPGAPNDNKGGFQ